MKLTQLSLNKPVALSMIVLAFVVLGLYGYFGMPVDLIPKVNYASMRITIYWQGATPDEVEKNIARLVERRLSTVDGLDKLNSSSSEGLYSASLVFLEGVNSDIAYQDVLASVSRVTRLLPEDIDPPVITKSDPSQLPVIEIAILSDKLNLVNLRSWVDQWLQDKFLSVKGVAGTEIVGGLKREIRISVKPEALVKYNLTLDNLTKILIEENVLQFAGKVSIDKYDLLVRTTGDFKSIEEMKNIIVLKNQVTKVLLKEIAEVEDKYEIINVYSRLNGKSAVKLRINKQPGANTVEVIENIKKELELIKPAFPEGIRINLLENQGIYIESSLKGVTNSALEASALLIFILYFFLGSFRQALVVIISLPVIIIINFGFMKTANFTINIFSLSGLVIAIGILVDNSIVVIENITRLKSLHPDRPFKEVIIEAVHEVNSSILAATLSFLALFLPFMLLQNPTVSLFKELILVVASIVVISLIIALTFTPLLSKVFLEKITINHDTFSLRFYDKLTLVYEKILNVIIKLRWLTIILFLLIGYLGFMVFGKLGSEFLPLVDDGRITVNVTLPTGSGLEETDNYIKNIENLLKNEKIVESYYVLSGGSGGFIVTNFSHIGGIDIQLVPVKDRNMSTKEYIKDLRKKLATIEYPGAKVFVSQKRIRGIRGGGSSDFQITVRGTELDIINNLSNDVVERLKNNEYFANVYQAIDFNKPEYQVMIDRIRASELGISVNSIAQTLKTYLSGSVASQYRENDQYYDIRVMILDNVLKSKNDVENLVLTTKDGGFIRLNEVAKVSFNRGPIQINRENQEKLITINVDVRNIYVSEAIKKAEKLLGDMTFPTGYTYKFAGQAEEMSKMTRDISLILIFSMFFSFVILSIQFNNLNFPIQIILSIPISLAGLIFLLYFTSLPVGATVVIGVLIIISATINDGVLLLTYAENIRHEKNLNQIQAVITSAKIRLRPRLMTTITATIGFVPLAFFGEEGGEMLQPMAVGTIGGLVFAIFVTLFYMPCIYVAINNIILKFKSIFSMN